MAHAVSLTYGRFDHMSATAVAMTTVLHVAVAAALWWISPLRPIDPYEDAIGVTMEQEKPAEIPHSQIPTAPPDPPIPEPAQPETTSAPPAPAPTPPVRLGLAPAVKPDKEPQATPGVEKPSPPQPETPAEEATQPDPPKQEPPQEQQQALAVPPPPPPPPPPSLETVLPPVEAPPPPLTSADIPRPPPPAPKSPPPAPPTPQPTQRAQPAARPAPAQQYPAPSPLSQLPQPRTPAGQQASRQAPTFQNPADLFGQRRVESEYLWQIARKVSLHQQFVGNATTEAGTVELKLTIARNGQLVGLVVSRSSGLPSLDNTSMNVVRAAGPYGPLPPEITGAQHTFTLPLYYKRN